MKQEEVLLTLKKNNMKYEVKIEYNDGKTAELTMSKSQLMKLTQLNMFGEVINVSYKPLKTEK